MNEWILNEQEKKQIEYDISMIEDYIKCLKMELKKKSSYKDYMIEKSNMIEFFTSAILTILKGR